MLFEIHAEKSASDKKVFLYDNQANVLTDEAGNAFKFPELDQPVQQKPATIFVGGGTTEGDLLPF